MSSFYSERTIDEVWQKGQLVYGYNEELYRKDAYGDWMLRTAYGNRSNNMGWEIGYVNSLEEGGAESLDNLQPLQWKNWDAQQEAFI